MPLPFERTRWSPSLADIVKYHLFRRQSRALFQSVEPSLAAGRCPPLGLIADTLDAQIAWLDAYLADLKPHTPLLRIADLAKAGMFTAVFSSAPDRLLDQALARAACATTPLTMEKPTRGAGQLAYYREWDDSVFQDTEDRRTRESAFLRTMLQQQLKTSDAVLIVGHAPQQTDLMNCLMAALQDRPELRVVWVEETIIDGEARPLIDWLREHHGAFTHLPTPELGEFLDAVASARGVERSAPQALEKPPSVVARVMNASVDIRPVLVYVPGFALISGLLDKLPRISLKMMVSLLALIMTIIGVINWRTWREYRAMTAPIDARVAVATAILDKQGSDEEVARAEGLVEQALRLRERITLPRRSIFSFEQLNTRINYHFEGLFRQLKDLRDLRITPALYRARMSDRLRTDPLLRSMGNQAPIQVLVDPKTERHLLFQGKPLLDFRLPRPLSAYASRPRLAIYARSRQLSRVLVKKAMLRDLQAGKLALEFDFSKTRSAPLDQVLRAQVRTIAGYVGEREKLFAPDGVVEWLREGKGTFYFVHLEAGGNIARNLLRARDLSARFPKVSAVIAFNTDEARAQLRRRAPAYTTLSVTPYRWGDAVRHLRGKTSLAYVQALINNNYLRWSLIDPVVLSLLVDYYRSVGAAPRSLALVYDRLLTHQLSSGKYSFASKMRALRELTLALHTQPRLTRETAIALLARKVAAGRSLEQASEMLGELVANGVLLLRAETYLEFLDEDFRRLCLAKALRALPDARRLAILLGAPNELVALYAGVIPSANALVDALLAPFLTVDQALREKQLDLELVNPFLPRLYRAAVAVQNGAVSEDRVVRLEQLLFRLSRHRIEYLAERALLALGAFSTPDIQRWALVGIESDAEFDHRLLRLTASAPNDIYLGAVERWLRRVGTPQDRGLSRRFRDAAARTPHYTVGEGMRDALATLAQIGSADALQVVVEHARRRADPRFSSRFWAGIRVSALAALLQHDQKGLVRPFLREIAADPEPWAALIPQLYRLDDAATRDALIAMISSKGDQRRGQRHVGRTIQTLSLLDSALLRPTVLAALAAKPSSAVDTRPQLALALGWHGDARDLPAVARLADELLVLAKSPRRDRFRAGHDEIGEALAHFGTRDAFRVFRLLYADPVWRAVGGGNMVRFLSAFRTPEAERFVAKELFCGLRSRHGHRLVQQLARFGTSAAREQINRLIAMLEGRQDRGFQLELCGAGKALEAVELLAIGRSLLPTAVLALSSFGEASDIPRFAQWAVGPSPELRRQAVRALGTFKVAAAGRTLVQAMRRFPELTFDVVKALARQALPESEAALLAALEGPGHFGRLQAMVALRRAGGRKALAALYPLQRDPARRLAVAKTLFLIAVRTMAEPPSPQEIVKLIPTLPRGAARPAVSEPSAKP